MTTARKALWGAALALLGGLAGCATPARIMTDIEIDRLCAKDGGIKVYERVELPAKYFYPSIKGDPRSGSVNLQAIQADAVTIGRYFELTSLFNELPHAAGADISIQRSHYKITERPTGRVIAEGVNYVRTGGDFGNPFISTAYSCSDRTRQFSSLLLSNTFSGSTP